MKRVNSSLELSYFYWLISQNLNKICKIFVALVLSGVLALGVVEAQVEYTMSKVLKGVGNNALRSSCTDELGNIYVAGLFGGSIDLNYGGSAFYFDGSGMFIAKYAPSGQLLWAKKFSQNIDPSTIKVVGNAMFVAGITSFGIEDFDPGPMTQDLGFYESSMFIARYDTACNLAWVRAVKGSVSNAKIDIEVDKDKNIYVSGHFSDTIDVDIDPVAQHILRSKTLGSLDVFIAKYSGTAVLLWSYSFGSPFDDKIFSPAVVSKNSVYLAGSFEGGFDANPGAGTNNLTNIGGTDIFIIKFSTSGVYQKSVVIGSNANDVPIRMTTDSSDNLYFSGQFKMNIDIDPGSGVTELIPIGSYGDAFLAKYNSSLDLIWYRQYYQYFNTSFRSLNYRANKGLYSLQTYGNSKAVLVDTLTGAVKWERELTQDYGDPALLATNKSGNVYYISTFYESSTIFRKAGTNVPLSGNGTDIFFIKYSPCTAAPTITQQPHSDTVCQKMPFSLTVAATSSSDKFYQWYECKMVNVNGIDDPNKIKYCYFQPVTGATWATYTNSKADQTARYYCKVYTDCYESFSDTVEVFVKVLPNITMSPDTQDVCLGLPVQFWVKTDKTSADFIYTWQVDSTGSGVFKNIVNNGVYNTTLQDTLQILKVALSHDKFRFKCIVSGTCGVSDTSDVAMLNVLRPAEITLQPKDSTVCMYAGAQFNVNATGSGITYNWLEKSKDWLLNPLMKNDPVANCSTLVLKKATTDMVYVCEVTGACNTVKSIDAKFVVNKPPVINQEPVSAQVCNGSTVLFAITTSEGIYSYEWQKKSNTGFNPITESLDYRGVTSRNLLVMARNSMSGEVYRCIVIGSCAPTAVSSEVTLRVYEVPAVVSSGFDTVVCPGSAVSFGVTGSGEGIKYQWQAIKDGIANNIYESSLYAGTNTNKLTVRSAESSINNYKYRCMVFGTCAPDAYSDTFSIKISAKPEVLSQPAASAVCSGDTVQLKFEVLGEGLSYQWEYASSTTFIDVPVNSSFIGSTTNQLSVVTNNQLMGYKFRCVVKGNCGVLIYSSNVALVVYPTPEITSLLRDTAVCETKSLDFSIKAIGAGISYQWQEDAGFGFYDLYNSSRYSGAKSAKLTLRSINLEQNNYQYRCVVFGTCEPSDTSKIAKLIVNSNPKPEITKEGVLYTCINDSLKLVVSTNIDANIDGYRFYNWSNDKNSDSIYVSQSGSYNVVITDKNGCSGTSPVLKINELVYNPEICLVGIDMETGNNLVIWEKAASAGVTGYKIYRQGNIAGSYDLLGTVAATQECLYSDGTSAQEKHAEFYKITAFDNCGNESPLSNVRYHKTLFLQYISSINGVNLSWEPYEIEDGEMNFTSYIIYKGDDSTVLHVVDTLAANVNRYTDADPDAMLRQKYYRVAGVKADACNPSISKRKAGGGIYVQAVSNMEDNRLRSTNVSYLNFNGLAMWVYPQPANEKINIAFSLKKAGDVSFEITNLLGSTVATIQSGWFEVNTSVISINLKQYKLETGIYLLKINTANGSLVKSFVIQ